MPYFSFYIGKNTGWRGDTQGMGNLYNLELPSDQPSEQALLSMVNQLVAAERPVHATTVNFDIARVWGPINPGGGGGSMRLVADLTGTGNVTPSANWYKELAFLNVWPLGRYGSKNRPQFLRKWIHSQASLGINATALDGSTQITTMPAGMATYRAAVSNITYGSGGPIAPLGSPRGHNTDNTNSYTYPYLEHRQLG
jgi:hypothetical protein